MSFQAMTEVRSVKGISATARLVLFVVAQYAGADGVCHPSQMTIAEDSGLSERAVRKAMQELRETGVLETDRRCRRNGSRTSDQITLLYYAPREERDDGARVVRKKADAPKDRPPANRQDVPVHIEGDDRHDVPVAKRHETSSLPAPGAGPTTFEPVRESTERMTDVIHSARASASASAKAQAAWAGKAPERVSPVRVEASWAEASRRTGVGDEALLAAVAAAVARDPDFGRARAMNLDRWLDEDRFLPWLAEADQAAPARAIWVGPIEVRAAVTAAMGAPATASYLDPARWDEGRRAVVTQTRFAAERLMEGARRVLAGLEVTVEFEGNAQRG